MGHSEGELDLLERSGFKEASYGSGSWASLRNKGNAPVVTK